MNQSRTQLVSNRKHERDYMRHSASPRNIKETVSTSQNELVPIKRIRVPNYNQKAQKKVNAKYDAPKETLIRNESHQL